MSDVIHATQRAIAIIRTRDTGANAPADTRACDGEHETFDAPSFFAGAAIAVMAGKQLDGDDLVFFDAAMPTCMRCRVLLDEALERPTS